VELVDRLSQKTEDLAIDSVTQHLVALLAASKP
jgi:hypothetical protein